MIVRNEADLIYVMRHLKQYVESLGEVADVAPSSGFWGLVLRVKRDFLTNRVIYEQFKDLGYDINTSIIHNHKLLQIPKVIGARVIVPYLTKLKNREIQNASKDKATSL